VRTNSAPGFDTSTEECGSHPGGGVAFGSFHLVSVDVFGDVYRRVAENLGDDLEGGALGEHE
jgi:hypothetical protein